VQSGRAAARRASRRRGDGITLGIQALDDGLLKLLGREHDADGARRAYRAAAKEFDNICVDLLFAVPGQTRESWRRTLDEVRSWKPAHVHHGLP